jgi:hypothetical protein
MVIDATKKLDYPYVPAWKSTWAPLAIPPREIVELVNKKWKLYIEEIKEDKRLLESEIEMLTEKIQSLEEKWNEHRKLMSLSEGEKEKEKHRSYPRRT